MGWFLAPELLLATIPEGALVTAGATGLGTAASVPAFSFTAGAAASGLFGTGIAAGDVLSGIGALSSVAGGRQGQVGADFEAMQFREEQENARVAAIQDEAQRRRQLMRTLSSINALRAGRGVEMFEGGTGDAIRKQVVLETEEDIATSKLNAMNRSRRFGLAAGQAEARGTAELLGGFGTAANILGRGFIRT